MMRRTVVLLAAAVCVATVCHAAIRSTLASPLTPDQTAELWYTPQPNRDLFWGVGGARLAPDPNATYKVMKLTDGQWPHAFRAGGDAPEMANRFIRRFKQKIEEGLALGR
jgi:hypothetical protein